MTIAVRSFLFAPGATRIRRGVTLKVHIHKADEGGFWAEVPSLPGCVSQGEPLEELRGNIRDAIEGWLLVEEPQQAAADQVIEIAV